VLSGLEGVRQSGAHPRVQTEIIGSKKSDKITRSVEYREKINQVGPEPKSVAFVTLRLLFRTKTRPAY
jgi:hypothetical protein